MARWIDQLFEVSMIQKPEDLQLSLEATDLVKLVRDAAEEYHHDGSLHRLMVRSEIDELVGQFDAARIERVLDNLLGNAVKYSPPGSCVSLELTAKHGWATIVVRDQGMGIPPEDLPHVFEPFRRGGNVVGRISGTGIGLSNAQRIVRRHGGTLSVESVLGQGSSFTIRLPVPFAPE
jgi:signal transduction histidine kinase